MSVDSIHPNLDGRREVAAIVGPGSPLLGPRPPWLHVLTASTPGYSIRFLNIQLHTGDILKCVYMSYVLCVYIMCYYAFYVLLCVLLYIMCLLLLCIFMYYYVLWMYM